MSEKCGNECIFCSSQCVSLKNFNLSPTAGDLRRHLKAYEQDREREERIAQEEGKTGGLGGNSAKKRKKGLAGTEGSLGHSRSDGAAEKVIMLYVSSRQRTRLASIDNTGFVSSILDSPLPLILSFSHVRVVDIVAMIAL